MHAASDKTGIEVDSLKWQAVATSFAQYHDPDDSDKSQQNLCPNVVINNAFANTGKEEDIFSSTISEISDAQKVDKHLKRVFKCKQKDDMQKYQISIFGDVKVITNEKIKLVIPRPLRMKAIK